MIRQPRSLARRLAWRLALVVIAATALAATAVGWRSVVAVRHLDDTALQVQASAVAAHIATGPDGRPELNLPSALDDAFLSSHGDNVFLADRCKWCRAVCLGSQGAIHPLFSHSGNAGPVPRAAVAAPSRGNARLHTHYRPLHHPGGAEP